MIVLRYRLTECLLLAGITIAKSDYLSPFLKERYDEQSMTSSTNFRAMIPKVEEDQLDCIRAEMEGQQVTVVFDGTSRVGEATSMALRWCRHGFTVVHRLVMQSTTL